MGKVKVNNHDDFQDIASIVAISNTYTTTESYIDPQYDIRVQKIGRIYKAFKRTSISGHWKANTGSAVVEKIALNEKLKRWVDECASLFGGMDICAVEAVHGKDGKDYIIEVNDCSMTLLGENLNVEDDRKEIVELVLQRMSARVPKAAPNTAPPPRMFGIVKEAERAAAKPAPAPAPQQPLSHGMLPSMPGMPSGPSSNPNPPPPQRMSGSSSNPAMQLQQRPNPGPISASVPPSASASLAGSASASASHTPNSTPKSTTPTSTSGRQPGSFSSQTSTPTKTGPPMANATNPIGPGGGGSSATKVTPTEDEDTFKNLKKTFANIFGDI